MLLLFQLHRRSQSTSMLLDANEDNVPSINLLTVHDRVSNLRFLLLNSSSSSLSFVSFYSYFGSAVDFRKSIFLLGSLEIESTHLLP